MTLEQIKALNDVANEVHLNAVDKGFHDFDESEAEFLTRTVANIHGEVSELWEAHRNNKLRSYCDKHEKMMALGMSPLDNCSEELADVIIRALDTAKRLGVDIGEAIATKHAYNKQRPWRHGSKLA